MLGIKASSIRSQVQQLLTVATIFSTAYMLWKGLGVLMNTESPVVVVLSESMSPAFERGDILFLSMSKSPIVSGDIVVFHLKGRDIPIVHRVLKVHEEDGTKKLSILTKGDNNQVHDRGLYNQGQLWLNEQDISGRVKGCLPYVGMITILMNEYPKMKVLLLMAMGMMSLINRE